MMSQYELLLNEIEGITRELIERGYRNDHLLKVFALNNIEPSNNGTNTIKKIRRIPQQEKHLIATRDALATTLENHVKFVDKAIHVHKNIDVDVTQFCKIAASTKAHNYEHLENNEDEKATQVIFTTTREFIFRERLTREALKNPEDYEDYDDEVIVQKRITRTCYDSIVITSDNKIILSIDLASHMRTPEINKAIAQLRVLAMLIIKGSGNKAWIPDNGIDVFPAIERLYENPEGGVIQLSFETHGTGPQNTYDVTVQGSDKDLRKSNYHLKGKEACQIQPYRIAKRFDRHGSKPVIYIPGYFRLLYGNNGRHLYTAQIRESSSLDDYLYLVNKLIK